MHVLAVGQLTGKDFAPHLEEETKVIRAWRAEGFVEGAFMKADRTGPVLLLADVDAAAARERLTGLPFVAHDLATFEFTELLDPPQLSG
jgi:hypothetical protein